MSDYPPVDDCLSRLTRFAAPAAVVLGVAFAGLGCEERPEVDPPSETETEEQIEEHIPHHTLPGDSEGETMVPVEREPGEE